MSDATLRTVPTAAAVFAALGAWRVSLIPSPIRGMEDIDAVVELREAAEVVGLLEALGEDVVWRTIRQALRRPPNPPKPPRPRPSPRPVPEAILDAVNYLRRQGDAARLQRFVDGWPSYRAGIIEHLERAHG